VLAIALSNATAASADDLITLAKSGVDEEVVNAYIENSPTPFILTSEDIVTLKDLGVPSKTIIEALKHNQPNDSTWKSDSATNPESAATPPGPAAVSPITAPPPEEQNISFFYSALYPYGSWIYLDGNWCWQPNATVIDDDWAPYCNRGHWVLTDYGWTWASNYTWGWAPFHYGRWFRRETYGWLWQPDNEWGPAWVVWRTGPDYCGWAPIPPRGRFEPRQGFYFGATLVSGDAELGLSFNDFSFVPMEHFYDRHPSAHIVPPFHAEDIYKRTVFERRSFSVVNNHLVNEGVPVQAVEKGTKTRITPVVLTEERPRPGEPIHNSTVSENKMTMYKPSISTAAPQTPPAIKERFTRGGAGFGQIITPQTNPQSWQSLQNGRQNAVERAAKNQSAVAQVAQTEKNRINLEAQKETNQSKQAVLKGEEAVQALKAQKAQQHVQRAQTWTPPKEIIVPKVMQPARQAAPTRPENKPSVARAPENKQPATIAPVNRPTEQFHAQVRELNTEARTEQQHRETIESTVRTQAQSQWTKQQQQQPRGETQQQKKGQGQGK
jgi:hypothetical protein